MLAAPQIMAQSKPEKLVYVGDNGPWHYVMVEEVAPAFEKATGIKVDFTLLPVDPWRARLRAELGAGSSGIDVAQFSISMTGWMAPHMEDHEPLLAQIKAKHPEFDWNDYLTGTKKAATYDGKLTRPAVPHHHRHLPLPEGAAGDRQASPSRRRTGSSS